MAWVPCGGCDDFYCTRHDLHVYDCECPSIEEWETDPYEHQQRGAPAQEETGR